MLRPYEEKPVRRFFLKEDPKEGEKEVFLHGEDARHLATVLRAKEGETVSLASPDGSSYMAEITSVSPEEIALHISFKESFGVELPMKVTLFQALPKGERMEWVLQKCTELGVSRIVPVELARCVSRVEPSKEKKKLERWEKILESAAKQSKRAVIPSLLPVLRFSPKKESFEDAWRKISGEALPPLRLFPHENASPSDALLPVLRERKKEDEIAYIIGPEGGFTEEETEALVKAGFRMLSLGRRILRTETAAMTMMAAIMLQTEAEE